jgi:hypothetical protein
MNNNSASFLCQSLAYRRTYSHRTAGDQRRLIAQFHRVSSMSAKWSVSCSDPLLVRTAMSADISTPVCLFISLGQRSR